MDESARFLTIDDLGRRSSAKWATYPDDVLPLWVAEMDVELAPAIQKALHGAVALGDTGYAHGGDLTEVYAAFSGDRYGWQPDTAGMSLVSDVMGGIAEVLRLATEPGDRVVITPPVYPPFRGFIEHTDRVTVDVPLLDVGDRHALDLDGLDQAFAQGATAFLLCHPHNPTGSVWDRETLTAVADVAARYDVLVLADEVHAPLTYAGATHVPFLSVDHPGARRGVACVAASKGWNLPGLKTAMTIAGVEAPKQLQQLPFEVQMGAGLFGVLAARAAFADGVPWLDSLLTALDHNRRLFGRLVARHLPDVDYRTPAATYLAWLDCRRLGLGDDPAAAFLDRGRVALNPGHTFGSQGHGFVRANLATSPSILEEAVTRMMTAVS